MNTKQPEAFAGADILDRVDDLRRSLDGSYRDTIVEAIYEEAERVAHKVAHTEVTRSYYLDQRIDRIVTSKIWGLPFMGLLLAVVFWVTIEGANVPSAMLAEALFWLGDRGVDLFNAMGMPWWVTGFVWQGVYLGLAWVLAVMLPPMAIFFPVFTILEDLGYLPRVAFNLDALFKKAGAHGKQALSMSMGLGCNAAGIIACRIIDSPRERLIAILTNNFMPCNGRWPTLIILATLFVAASFPPAYAAIAAQQAQGLDQEAFVKLLADHDMDHAKFDRVATEWQARMSRDATATIATIYGAAFSGAGAGQFGAAGAAAGAVAASDGAGGIGYGVEQGAAGEAPIPMEKWIEIMGAQDAWSSQGKDVNAMLKEVFDMNALDWSNVSAWWTTHLMANVAEYAAAMDRIEVYAKQYGKVDGADDDVEF